MPPLRVLPRPVATGGVAPVRLKQKSTPMAMSQRPRQARAAGRARPRRRRWSRISASVTGRKSEHVDADVDLAGQGCEAAVAVAVQVERAAGHAVPAAQGVVAEHEEAAVLLELGVGLDARPAGKAGGRRAVVVADDQVLPAGQRRPAAAPSAPRAGGPRSRRGARPRRRPSRPRSSAPPWPRPSRRPRRTAAGTGRARRRGRSGGRSVKSRATGSGRADDPDAGPTC